MEGYRNVTELTRDELQEVKCQYYSEYLDEHEGRCMSYGEIADIDDIIDDETIFTEYQDTVFTDDDFFCNVA